MTATIPFKELKLRLLFYDRGCSFAVF